MNHIYIATRWDNKGAAQLISSRLTTMGYQVTSRWLWLHQDTKVVGRQRVEALNDLRDIREADILILLAAEEGGTGMWVELGYALALGKTIYYVGPPRGIFPSLPQIRHKATIKELLDELAEGVRE